MEQVEAARERILCDVSGARRLDLAYVGVVAGLWTALGEGPLEPRALAARAGQDPDYVRRWADAAYAFELVDFDDRGRLSATALGAAFEPTRAGTAMPMAVGHALGAHMAARAASLMSDGTQPGEQVLGELPSVLPWFGPMLEATFGPLFEQHILPALPLFEALAALGPVVDLGCGNGWYLRRLAQAHPTLRGWGLDQFAPSIEGARARSRAEGLDARLHFELGDLTTFTPDEPLGAVAMNRALHHVWPQRASIIDTVARHLAPGGAFVIWEPAWPDDRTALRGPRGPMMAFQNLAEHVQGNRFLRSEEISEALRAGGLAPTTHRFMGGAEAIVVGRKPG